MLRAERNTRARRNSSIGVDDLGEAKSVGPFSSKLTYQIDGYSLRVAGTVRTRVLFTTDGVWVTVQVEGSHNQWEVVHLAFDY